MEIILAPSRLPRPDYGANGRVPRRTPYEQRLPQITRSVYTEEDGLCHDSSDRGRRVMVRGGRHDLGERPYGHLQLLRLLGLRVQHTLTARQAAFRQGILGPLGHCGRPDPLVWRFFYRGTWREIRWVGRRWLYFFLFYVEFRVIHYLRRRQRPVWTVRGAL